MSVVAELQRRNVVRVALLYGLASWLILQVADVLVPALALPGWVMRLVSLLLILGFPLVLIFCWIYELTPEGLKRQLEVDRDQSIARETGRKINYLIGALGAVAIVMIVVERHEQRRRQRVLFGRLVRGTAQRVGPLAGAEGDRADVLLCLQGQGRQDLRHRASYRSRTCSRAASGSPGRRCASPPSSSALPTARTCGRRPTIARSRTSSRFRTTSRHRWSRHWR